MSVCVYSVFVLSCMQVAALWRADPPSKESYRLYKKLRNWKRGQGPEKGCRAKDEDDEYCHVWGVCVTNNNRFSIGWLDILALLLKLQRIITAHNPWLYKTRSIPYWTTSASAVTDLLLIYVSVTYESVRTNDQRRMTELILGSPC
jgi:hypothetical protein